MVTEITLNDAFQLYGAELERQMVGLTQSDRQIKRFMVYSPTVKRTVALSLVDLIREVQNRTELGKVKVVEYVQQLMDSKGEPLYIIKT